MTKAHLSENLRSLAIFSCFLASSTLTMASVHISMAFLAFIAFGFVFSFGRVEGHLDDDFLVIFVIIPGAPIKLPLCRPGRLHRILKFFLGGFWWEGSDFQSGDGSAMFSLKSGASTHGLMRLTSCFCGSAMILGLFLFTQDLACGLRRIVLDGESGDMTILPPKIADREVDPRCKKQIKTPKKGSGNNILVG